MKNYLIIGGSFGIGKSLTRSLAAEWAPSIRVNAITPSLTNTPLAGKLLGTEEKKNSSVERHPLKKVGSPKDISEMAAFLLSDRSSWMTGQIIHLDVGMSNIK
jgi:NAD(P)-dependent dehydrogenase (short-subunit alcohol dehydrogenase family)